MEQLLSIHTVPLQYELEITPNRLEYRSQASQLDINRIDGGGIRMQSRPARLEISSFEARNSVCPTTRNSTRQAAQKGLSAAQSYTAQSAKEGRMLANATPDQDMLREIIRQRASVSTGEFSLAFIPTTGPELNYSEPDLDIQYQADRLQFDVRISKGDLEFIPGDVTMNITQWPDVVIEYIGKPLYIPPRDGDSFQARA